jgi:protein involved in polysaccharide export with SLBB domain
MKNFFRNPVSIFSIFFVAIAALPVLSQTTDPDALKELMQEKKPTAETVAQPQGMALESTIDPERYYVGPSDVIAVNIWMSPPVSATLTVTPEGTLLIPLVGEVKVSDTTLAEAKRRVLEAIRKKYRSPDISVTLIRPRPIIITVTGNVLNPGLYTLNAIDRANKAIEEANVPQHTQTQEELARILELMSTRNISLKHHDGTQDRVDIAKFLATKKDQWDPYLREGDVVIVPRKNLYKDVIAIYGEVNSPGRYEYVEGDSLLDAIQLAQGLQPLAIQDSVEFWRLDPQGSIQSKQVISLPQVLAHQQPNIALLPGDRIIVKARVDLREDYRVTIEGEVIHPGIYPITKNQTRLSEVLKQCGGMTSFAYLKGAKLYRHSISPRDIDLDRALSLRGVTVPEDTGYYHLETDLRLEREIVNVDFEKLVSQNDTTQDVILQTEDDIVIPVLPKTIYVFGQVQSPGHIPFIPGKGADYYVEKAGGFIEEARVNDLTIIKANTRQWLSPDETKLEAGDYIWVPKKPYHPFVYFSGIARDIGETVGAFVSIAIVVYTIAKH